jgi:predicted transcriptional regulator
VETRGAAASHEAAAERVTRSADELYGRLKAGVRDWGDTTKTEAEKAADALQKAIGREREALRGGIEALDAKKAALLASIEAETKSGDVTVQETERIKKALTDLAGKYIEANGTIDPVLQGWLDKYKLHVEGIDSVQKKLLEADKNLKERLLKDAGVSATNAKATARPSGEQDELSDAARKAEELRKTIAEIKGKQEIGPISDEELKRLYDAEDALKDIERQIGAVVDTFSDVEARAKKFGDVESANAVLMGEVNKQAQKFVDLGEAGAIAIGGQTDEASALDAIWDEIIARQKKIDEGLQGATTATGDLAAKAVEVGLGFAGADESVLHWERTLDASGQTVWKLTNLIEEAGKTGDIVWKRGADGLETMTNDAEAVADEFATIGSNANEVGSAITQAAEAGAKSLEDLGAHFETIDDWLDKINTKLDSMKDKLQAMPSIGGE